MENQKQKAVSTENIVRIPVSVSMPGGTQQCVVETVCGCGTS